MIDFPFFPFKRYSIYFCRDEAKIIKSKTIVYRCSFPFPPETRRWMDKAYRMCFPKPTALIFFKQKICTLSFKSLVRLFIYDNNYISCFFVWMLVRFSVENILFTMRCTLIDRCLQNLLFFNDFLSITVFAFVGFIDLLSCSSTIFTRDSWLRIHTWTNHGHFGFHTSTIAARTGWGSSK